MNFHRKIIDSDVLDGLEHFLRTAVSSGLMVREQPHGLTCGARLLYESFD